MLSLNLQLFTEEKMNKYTKTYNVILDNMDLIEYRLRPISAIMYLQDAFARYTATKAMAAYDMFKENIYWVVGEFNIDFVDSLPFWSEEIKVEIWISELSKLKIYTDYNIYYQNKVIAKGNACWFLINSDTKRPAKTDIVKDRFEVVNDLVLGEHKKFFLPPITEKVAEIKHKMNLSDLDFNNHVNNKSYINIAEMTAPFEYKKAHKLKQLNIRFNQETFLDDILICSLYKTDTPDVFAHKLEKDGVSVCEILTRWEKGASKETIDNYDLAVKSE